jgi:hypothetical protein
MIDIAAVFIAWLLRCAGWIYWHAWRRYMND